MTPPRDNRRTVWTRVAILIIILGVVGAGLIYWRHASIKKSPSKAALPLLVNTPRYLVSLGDSVAAGDGLPVTSTSTLAQACSQSEQAYPVLVAQAKGLTLKQFACSGATVTSGVLGAQATNGQTVSPQLAAASSFITGSDVLITIGANDVSWEQELYTCATTDCETTSNLTTFEQGVTTLHANLSAMLQDIYKLQPHTVILHLYYPLLSSGDTCLSGYGITASKIQWVNDREAELNATISKAAKDFNAQTSQISFSNHLLCNADSWIQGLSSTAPLHPTAAGQASIAAQDERLL